MLIVPILCIVTSVTLQALSLGRMPTANAQQQLACIQAVLYRSQGSLETVVTMVQARLQGTEEQARTFIAQFKILFDPKHPPHVFPLQCPAQYS